MARAKKSAKKSSPAKSTARKPAPPAAKKGAAKQPRPRPAAPKAALVKKGAKPGKPAKAAAKKPRAAEPEIDPVDEILEILACPPSTADQMCEVCEEGLDAIQDNLPHVAAAELVWRERPERAELGDAITALIEELQRHAQALAQIHERLQPLAQDPAEHDDLDPAEVMDRIRPLLEHHAHDHDHDHDHDHPHDHDGN